MRRGRPIRSSEVRILGSLRYAILLVGATVLLAACSGSDGPEHDVDARPSLADATFVGRDSCVRCHAREAALYTGSHHDLAMQLASAETILAEFNGASMTHFGERSDFSIEGDRFVARLTGPDGKPTSYDVRYVFGVEPLQQYLVEFPGGRLQTLPTCWDTRPAEEGGQRWFHIYPDERIPHTDELHWTRGLQNWNFMCAECHSTGLKRNYDVATDTYATEWNEIDVSCEACHGPASRHVEWAVARERGEKTEISGYGLVTQLKQPPATWIIDPETGNARRDPPLQSQAQLDACAPCHSRRSALRDGRLHGRPFLDSYLPALLDEDLYHSDGQILDEVYVYGSFVQSKMHAQGVRCTDCHEPHSGRLVAEGNTLCAQCHDRDRYDTPSHHHHEMGKPGAQCVDCHMPSRTYMVVDPRRDHSFRVPRPDLTVTTGAPNACTSCHQEQGARWAAERVVEWYGENRRSESHWGETLHAARSEEPPAGAAARLAAIAQDGEVPGIARATALAELRWFGGAELVRGVELGATDADPLVRIGATRAGEGLPLDLRAPLFPLLDDPLLAVRAEAARVLAPCRPEDATDRERLTRAVDEFIATQLAGAERASSGLNLGLLYTELGRVEDAEREYRRGIAIDPREAACHVNLADLYRMLGRDDEGERVLRDAIVSTSENPEVVHSLGLLLARQQRYEEALGFLGRAADLRPENPRMAFVYGVALESRGRIDLAVEVYAEALERHPRNADILEAMAAAQAQRGAFEEARRHARRLVEVAPERPGARELLQSLQGR